MPQRILLALAAWCAAPIAAAPIAAAPIAAAPMSIVETASTTPTLSTLVKALQAGGLVDTLSGPGPFTVFAPSDLAFAQLPSTTLATLLTPKNLKEYLANRHILLYHVASGNIPSTDFGPRQEVTTLNGAQVQVVKNYTAPPPYGKVQVYVNQAQVQVADVVCTNGIVHIINSVLLPANATARGGGATAGKPQQLKTPVAGASVAPMAVATRGSAPMNIVETANATADLSTLVKALQAGVLVDTLSGAGPFTVFAPTDLAFDELPSGTLASLLDPRNLKQLQAVLLYHVVSGSIPSTDFGPRQEVTTLNGAQVQVVKNFTAPPPYGKAQVYVNQAQVQLADVGCTNGIVHIINSVLLPPQWQLATGTAAD